ncbi:MAG: hypothetical protein AB8G95_29635 [Anaerolineae bacterium]
MQKVMYADCDTPQSFESPLPVVLQKQREDQLSSTPHSKKKARPIEHTRIWVVNGSTNTQAKSDVAAEPIA